MPNVSCLAIKPAISEVRRAVLDKPPPDSFNFSGGSSATAARSETSDPAGFLKFVFHGILTFSRMKRRGVEPITDESRDISVVLVFNSMTMPALLHDPAFAGLSVTSTQ